MVWELCRTDDMWLRSLIFMHTCYSSSRKFTGHWSKWLHNRESLFILTHFTLPPLLSILVRQAKTLINMHRSTYTLRVSMLFILCLCILGSSQMSHKGNYILFPTNWQSCKFEMEQSYFQASLLMETWVKLCKKIIHSSWLKCTRAGIRCMIHQQILH